MPKLNFYDTDAVKAFTLDVLVEGVETRRDLDFERRQSAAAWETAREQRTRADKADAAIAAAISTLSNLLEARKMASKSAGVTLTGSSLTPWTF